MSENIPSINNWIEGDGQEYLRYAVNASEPIEQQTNRKKSEMLSDKEKAEFLSQFMQSAVAEIPENSKSSPNRKKKPISGRFNEENLEFLSEIGGQTTTMMNCLVTVLRTESIKLGLYTPPDNDNKVVKPLKNRIAPKTDP